MNVWAAFLRMRSAAAKNGVKLDVNSAFRTMAKQTKLRRDYELGRGSLAARPGYSTHQNGAAVDIAVRENSNILPWLRSNAGAYGFWESVPSENWHWQYDPSRDRGTP